MNEEVKTSSVSISNTRVVFLLLGLCVITTAVFVVMLLQGGHNYQEVFNVSVAQQSTYNVFTQLSADDPMPLYYFMIHSLSRWFVPTLQLLRILSWVCYLLLLPAAYALGKRATSDRRVGLLAAALIGLSPFVIWYSSRATVYVLLLLLTLLNAYFFIGVLEKKKRQWVGYLISGLFGLGLHYFFGVVLLAQLIFYFLKRNGFPRMNRIMMGFAGIVFLAALSIWLRYSLLHSDLWHHLPYTGKPSATNAFILFVQFVFGFQSVVTTTLIISFWPLLVVLGLLAVQKYVRPPDAVQYFAFAAFVPVIAVFALSWLWKPLYLSSYFIVCLPPFMVLVAWYLVAFDLKALAWARSILVASMFLMLFFELLNPQRALVDDYLGAAPVRQSALTSEVLTNQRLHQGL
jgi:uncharacterized membrane protein